MKTSLSWIKAYVPELDVSYQEYMDGMTLSGTKVENYEVFDADLDKIVIGQIVSVEKHPNADKLMICQVNIGKETIQIVTGAPNVKVGAKVPVVLDGGRVAGGHDGSKTPGGVVIKNGQLRGVDSFGMMCSIEEMGSDREMFPEAPENGLYIFDDDAEVGADAIEALGFHDAVYEYEVTSNRVDCYSVIGIAREAAATFRKPFILPEIKPTGNSENAADYVKVTVKDPELCPRYIARVVKNVKIGPSPKWMQRRLASVGIRPINNLVDITNYVMEEYGQPMHAYDLSTIAGREIIVRRAEQGEIFTTLDGQERKLDDQVVVICDGEKAVGIGGIMGGENSMITDNVQTVLFEAANFDGTNIRLSSKRIGLRTDASGKFEKGLDPNQDELAINRACELIEELACGEVVGGKVDVYPSVKEGNRVKLEPEKINALLGTDVSKEDMIEYLKRVDLAYDAGMDEIVVPSWRQDVKCMNDLAEEVARFYGYDKIPTTLPSGEATSGKLSLKMRLEEMARDIAESFGFSQAMTYSFESPKVYDKLLLEKDDALRNAIVISNPLGEDFSIMRTLPLNGMLTSLATNYNYRNKNVRLYELANIYLPKALPLTELPEERMQFVMGAYGEVDFYEMKAVVEGIFASFGMTARVQYENKGGYTFLHPGRQAVIAYEGTVCGYLGELHPMVLDGYGIGERAYVAVLDMPAVIPFATFDRKFTQVPRFPAVTRDISLVVPREISSGRIIDVIEKNGGAILEHCDLFDLYEGAQILAGYKSMAYTIRFRAKDKTLDENDITPVMNQIMEGLKELGITLRQ